MDKIELELTKDQGRELLRALVRYFRRTDGRVLVEVLLDELDEGSRSAVALAITP